MSNRDYNIILGILVTIACIIAAVLSYVVYNEIRTTPTPLPDTPTPSRPDDAWLRIKTTGILRAGTSADYPPFTFRKDDASLDGLDIAIINEVGRRLGVQDVDLKDMPFSQIIWTLEQKQIDVAVAAMSISPERLERVDFSEPYFISEDATLANSESDIEQLLRVEDMAPFRIGVQKTSVFSNWLHDTLVETGLMSESQLVEYEDMSSAMGDLRLGRIDLVVLDFQPADVAVKQGGVKLVSQGLHIQKFGIGIPKEEPTLLAQVNTALASMKNDGTLAALIQQKTGVVVPGPTPTATPTATLTATPGITITPGSCVDALVAEDLNMKTPQTLRPGIQFRKGWRLWNTGTCTWDERYRLAFDRHDPLGGRDTPIRGQVAPEGVYDIYVDMVAPNTPGRYESIWRMRNHSDQPFGPDLSVTINVVAPITETPNPDAPRIDRFTIDPPTQILLGKTVTIAWQVSGDVDKVRILRDDVVLLDGNQLGGAWLDNPPVEGPVTYLIEAEGPGGKNSRQQTIQVVDITQTPTWTPTSTWTPTWTPTPGTPTPVPPAISSFTVNPGQIPTGDCTAVSWQVGGDVERITITRNGELLLDFAPIASSQLDCSPGEGSYVYQLDVLGENGQSETAQQPLIVVDVPTVPPVEDTSWSLDGIMNNEGDLVPLVEDTSITADFAVGGSLSGETGCNPYATSYSVDGSSISIGSPGVGITFCEEPEGVMDQEARYLDLLPQSVSYDTSSGSLSLLDSNGRVILLYVAR